MKLSILRDARITHRDTLVGWALTKDDAEELEREVLTASHGAFRPAPLRTGSTIFGVPVVVIPAPYLTQSVITMKDGTAVPLGWSVFLG